MKYPNEVQKFLNEYEPAPYAIDPHELANLKEQISYAKERAEHWQTRIHKLTAGLKTMCSHTDKVVDEYYFEGSYNDRAYTTYTVKCKNCGKKLFEHTKMHDWYG
jgi:hypothetical protein